MDLFEKERYELATEKICEELTAGCKELPENWADFFRVQMTFLSYICKAYEEIDEKTVFGVNTERLIEINKTIYSDIAGDNYSKSYCNPTYAETIFGLHMGRIISVIAYEMRSCIQYAFESDGFRILMRLELLLELYRAVLDGVSDDEETLIATLKDIIYWYVSDYFEDESEIRVKEMVDPDMDFATKIVLQADLSNPDYLYLYGEYITENEIKMAQYMASLPQDKIDKMADTFTEGYRIGFVTTGKDLSKKKTGNIRYPLGMERVIKKSIANFEKIGLKPVIYRAASSLFRRQDLSKIGFFGGNPNKQYDYDHSKDEAIYLDGQIVTRKLECLKEAFENHKEDAGFHAGPAVMEIFGEKPFAPISKDEVLKLSAEQEQLSVKMAVKSGQLTNQYIKGEERSFTIIAFPTPEIGPDFDRIFDETLEINTLDYYLYQKLQQTIIDELDKAEYVHILGKDGNETDIKVSLMALTDPAKQTKFENCVADVNIPVGEVFTSPVLKGTTGLLNVSMVYLDGLRYDNLKVWLKDGMVDAYTCDNYEDEAKSKAFFKENVLYNHDTLPLGEFAIGTNTRAYKMGQDFNIQGLLPILIAEKTGPHFALGDTCYSYAEDVAVFNPDGKEIVARDNEVSLLRKTDASKAYFSCHTDITLPYDEIGLVTAVCKDGSSIDIIKNGKFVLKGLEELNKYLAN